MACLAPAAYHSQWVDQMRALSSLPALPDCSTGKVLDRLNDNRRQAKLEPQSSMFKLWLACLRACPHSQAAICSISEVETTVMRAELDALTVGSDAVCVRYIDPQISAASKPTHLARAFNTAHSVAQLLQRIPRDGPLILASFTSGRTWHQVSRIKLVIDAVRDQPYQLLVTCGEYNVSRLESQVPANVHLTSYAPHSLVQPRTAACVTHRGHGTVTACMTFGLPIVALLKHG